MYLGFFLGGLWVFLLLLFFRASPMAFESSQPRGPIRATAAGQCHSHSNAISVMQLILQPILFSGLRIWYWAATAQGNTRSLTHWARPVIEPTSSWILGGFLIHWATMGTPMSHCWLKIELNALDSQLSRK